MRLELHKIKVKDVKWGDATKVEDGILYVNREEIIDLLSSDDRLESVEVDLARPGERVRIVPVKDVIEPRCKLEGEGDVFPGFIGDVEGAVGQGKTLALAGAAVVTCGKIVGFQEGIIDMSGPGAEYTPFSKTNNVVLVFTPKAGIERHDYEAACRVAGLKVAHFLAVKAKGAHPDEVQTYELEEITKRPDHLNKLPRVAYIYMLQSQGLLHDTYVYGVDAKKILPTLIHPNEVFDGAIVSGNCVSACDKNSTYAHQNNPVIEALYKRHGKDINFIGCIITNENVTLQDKKRSSSYAVKLAKMLGVEGVIITEEGFGNPDTDLIMNCRKAERAGIKTVLITDEYAGRDGASQSLADAAPEADAVVSVGNANPTVKLPPMEKVIGFSEFVDVIAGGFSGALKQDGSIEVELQAITGATSELGFTCLSAETR